MHAACHDGIRPWAGTPVETDRLTLRPIAEGDTPQLVAHLGDAEVSTTTAYIPHPFTAEDAGALIARARAGREQGSEVMFAIIARQTGELVGGINVLLEGEVGEFGYWVAKAHWGRGIATEALRAMTGFTFEHFAVARVAAHNMTRNPASERVIAKAGLVFTGTGEGQRGRCAGEAVRTHELSRADWQAHRARLPKLLVAAVALVDADGRVLLQQRPQGKSMAGTWEFPGGKMLAGEAPEAALVRELHEELGLDVAPGCLAPLSFASHAYDTFHLLMLLYVCRNWAGPATAREGQALKWLRPNRMAGLAMPPADVPLVATLRDLL